METPEAAANRLQKLVPSDVNGWGVVRCDGSMEELASYRAGSGDFGWKVKAECAVGDLLVGTVGQGRSRIVVNVNRVEGLNSRGVEWAPASDVPIVPSLGWDEIGSRFGRRIAWTRLDGVIARRFVDAVAGELRANADVPEKEGEVRLGRCRRRSEKNRLRKLDQARGVCEGCKRNFRLGFGARGDRALEVHHLKPLSQTGDATETSLRDLAVLCATCHRLVHADPQLRIQGLKSGWRRMASEVAPVS